MTATETRGDRLLRAGRLRAAADAYAGELAEAGTADVERYVMVRHRLAWCLLQTGRVPEVIDLYEGVRVPGDHHATRMLGDLYAETGRHEDAVRSYMSVLAWVADRLTATFVSTAVLAHRLRSAVDSGLRPCVVAVLQEAMYRRGNGFRRRSLGLAMLWSCLADVHELLRDESTAAGYRQAFSRYWAWYAGAEHDCVVALSGRSSGGGVRPVPVP